MNEPKIAVRKESKPLSPGGGELPGWSFWGWIGWGFLVVGGTDFLLTWIPFQIGNPEWEFGTVTASLNGLPVPLLGLGLVIASAWENGRRWVGGFALACAVLLLMIVGGGMLLWALSVPLALQSVPAELAVGLKKALVKTTVQGVAYPVVLAYLAWVGLKVARGRV